MVSLSYLHALLRQITVAGRHVDKGIRLIFFAVIEKRAFLKRLPRFVRKASSVVQGNVHPEILIVIERIGIAVFDDEHPLEKSGVQIHVEIRFAHQIFAIRNGKIQIHPNIFHFGNSRDIRNVLDRDKVQPIRSVGLRHGIFFLRVAI